MRALRPILAAFSFATVVVACVDSTSTTGPELMVIEAFLYAGQPVSNVRVTSALPLSSTDSTAPPLNDAQVRLIRNGTAYDLVATGQDGYYRDASASVAVSPGDVFQLEVQRSGVTAWSETTVPSKPTGVAVSRATVNAPTFGGGFGFGPGGPGADTTGQLAVTWTNGDHQTYYVVVESVDSNAVSFLPAQLQRFRGRLFRMVNQPTTNDFEVVNTQTLEYLGRHRVTVYRVNREYAQLYENRVQDSRDLNEPPSNIHNGLGVFSAFASDSAFFSVVEP